MQDQRCIATSVQASDEYLATQRTPLQAQIRNNHGIDSRINNSKNMRTKLSRCISITPCIVWILSLLFFVHCSLCSSLPLSVTSSTAPGSELRPIGVLACRTAGLRKVGGGLGTKTGCGAYFACSPEHGFALSGDIAFISCRPGKLCTPLLVASSFMLSDATRGRTCSPSLHHCGALMRKPVRVNLAPCTLHKAPFLLRSTRR